LPLDSAALAPFDNLKVCDGTKLKIPMHGIFNFGRPSRDRWKTYMALVREIFEAILDPKELTVLI
jgi:hypothetical protein